MRSEPIIIFKEGEMSQLMDQLWIAGVRPSERIVEPQNRDHMDGEITWMRSLVEKILE